MRRVVAVSLGLVILSAACARAQECPGNPAAIGTSRELAIDPAEHPRLGSMQYPETLPLADKEVVLTFDDGPMPPFSTRVLEILAAECVKATYFLVGQMATSFPQAARRAYFAGHTIGTHSQSHPFRFARLSSEAVEQQIEQGIASVTAAIGEPNALAPFFRIPGLQRSETIDAQIAAHSLVAWSADVVADDWFHHIKASEIIARAIRRLEAKGKGILLLHDIHPATVVALPGLLKELKARGYRIVHVVPARPGEPATVTAAQAWDRNGGRPSWPRVTATSAPDRIALPAPEVQAFEVTQPASEPPAWPAEGVSAASEVPRAAERKSRWPEKVVGVHFSAAPELPIPSLPDIGVSLDGRQIVGDTLGLRSSLEVVGPNARAALIPPSQARAEASQTVTP